MESKTIVYPTDFSTCAENALHYAIAMAQALKCTIQMVHFLDVSQTIAADENPARVLRELEILEKKVQRRLNKRTIKIHENNVNCQSEVLKGDRFTWLRNYLQEQNPQMVVMGTKGSSNLANKIMGSETYAVIKTCGLPVLAVPEMASYTALKKMIFATDYQKNDIDNLEFLLKIAEHHQATVDVVHVTEEDLKDSEKSAYVANVRDEVYDRVRYRNLDFKFLYAADVAERLELFLKESNADVLAMVTRKRNLLDRIFSKSLTKKMVYHTHTPLLVFS